MRFGLCSIGDFNLENGNRKCESMYSDNNYDYDLLLIYPMNKYAQLRTFFSLQMSIN